MKRDQSFVKQFFKGIKAKCSCTQQETSSVASCFVFKFFSSVSSVSLTVQ